MTYKIIVKCKIGLGLPFKFLALVFFICSGFASCMVAQQSEVTEGGGLQAGKIVDGFQMVAILDKDQGIIHCHIRIVATNEIDYPSFDFGYCEFVRLEIQESTAWTRLAACQFGINAAHGFIPYFTKRIDPGQIVTNKLTPWPVLTRGEYLKISKGNTNEAILTEQLNKWVADRQEKCRDDTLAFDLIETDWPANVFAQALVKIRAVQSFRIKSDGIGEQTRMLYSQELPLDTSLIRSYINQKSKITGK